MCLTLNAVLCWNHIAVLRVRPRHLLNLSLGVLVAYLSVPIVQNLLSSRQIMNTSFDSFRLVNTYGAFGRYLARKHVTRAEDSFSFDWLWNRADRNTIVFERRMQCSHSAHLR